LVLLSELGLGTLTLKHVARTPHEARPYVWHVLRLRLLVSALAVLAFVGLGAFLGGELAPWLWCAPMVAILPVYGIFSAVFRALERMAWVAVLNVGMLLVQVGLLATLQANTALTLEGALIVNTLTSLGQLGVAAGLYGFVVARHLPTAVIVYDVRDLLKQALPFAIASALGALQARLAIILLERSASAHVVGFFVVALRYVDVVRLLPMAYYDALFPRVAQGQTAGELGSTFRRALFVMGAYGVVAGVALAWGAPFAVWLVLGQFAPVSIDTLTVFAVGILPLCLRGVLNVFCYALDAEAVANRVSLITLGALVLSVLGFGAAMRAEWLAWALVWGDVLACALLWANRPPILRLVR
jgi:O-antigen/teichoic acid export membrane protein